MRWFKNLKKWQKGGLIGCAVGLLLACILLLISPPSHYNSLGERIAYLHGALYILPGILTIILYGDIGGAVLDYGGAVSIIIFYGGLGAIFGRFQQIDNPARKWLLTAVLALFLLLFYVIHFVTYII